MISLIYATARPNLIWDTINCWLTKASGFLPIDVVVCTDSDTNEDVYRILGIHSVYFTINYNYQNCVCAYNEAAQRAKGDIFVQIADDLFPCLGWDKLITEALDITKPQVLLISDDHLGRSTTRHATRIK
jgi:hypothetical protein